MVAVAVMCACSASSTDAESSAPTAPQSGSSADSKSADAGSPLAAYLPGWDSTGPADLTDSQRAEVKAKELRLQEVVADCMAHQGFAYTPWASSVDRYALMAEAPQQGTMEYAQKYGFGIVANPVRDIFMQQDAEVDPNEAYKNGLSPSARYAYITALKGKNAADIDRGMEERNPVPKNGPPPPDDGGGCEGVANESVFDDDEASRAAVDLYNAAKRALSNIDSDPRMVQATQEWSDCMVGLGHGRYSRRIDVSNDFMTRSFNIDRSDGSAVAALQAAEIKAAVDDLTCAESVGYTATNDALRDEVERKFIADHQTELDAYVAKYGNR